jgi:hypothetical protein
MKNRQRVDQHIAPLRWAAPAPVVFEDPRIAKHVAMRQHRSFGAPGGTTGVNDDCHLIGVAGHWRVRVAAMRCALQQAARAIVVQGEYPGRSRLKGQFADPAKVLRTAHDHGGLGVADEVGHLGALVGGIEWHINQAGAQHCEIKHQRFNRLFNLNQNACIGWQTQRLQVVGQHRAATIQIAPGVEQAGIGFYSGAFQICRKRLAQGCIYIRGRAGHGHLFLGDGCKWRVRRQKTCGRLSRNALTPSRCSGWVA